ncbi:MAG: ORF6N domain-containing protein [Candidatus Aadella gelida]|nr:ORF6N domain-containing protein [Candidatus Aadella gelida]
MKRQIKDLIPQETIENKILRIRNKKVLLDRDLANLYNVSTKALNQAVKRNLSRFPDMFMFQLTRSGRNKPVTNCDRFKLLKHSSSLPFAFTEQGVAMLSSVLKSERAIQVNIQIMILFTKLREIILTNRDLQRKIEDMEKKYDQQFQVVFDAIKQLLIKPEKPKKRIGFHQH